MRLVTHAPFSKKGAVHYAKIPKMQGVDLNKYRVTARQEVRLTVLV